jgi:hypothetical protein
MSHKYDISNAANMPYVCFTLPCPAVQHTSQLQYKLQHKAFQELFRDHVVRPPCQEHRGKRGSEGVWLCVHECLGHLRVCACKCGECTHAESLLVQGAEGGG